MATQLFFILTDSTIHRGSNDSPDLDYTNRPAGRGWQTAKMSTSRGSGNSTADAATVTGPTTGIPMDTVTSMEWMSDPIDQDVTISGTVTINLWAHEGNMNANVAINVAIYRVNCQTLAKTLILKTARTTEVAVTTSAVNNFTATPTSTALNKGDRLLFVVFGDDSTSNMGSGFSFNFNYNGTTGGATGDSYVSFTETFGFITATPSGTTLYMTDTDSDVSVGTVEKEMWTSRGGGVVGPLAHDTSTAGWLGSPLQFLSGGTAIEWYSRRLTAFTLSGLVTINLRGGRLFGGSGTGEGNFRVQIARVDADGTNAQVWAEACFPISSPISTGEFAINGPVIAGDDLAFTDGQRLRVRFYGGDGNIMPYDNSGGSTMRMWYAGTSGGASGDTFITLTQSVSEFVPATLVLPQGFVDFSDPGVL